MSTLFDDDCFINFTDIHTNIQTNIQTNIHTNIHTNIQTNLQNIITKSDNIKEKYNKYDKTTTETYRVMRAQHLDPITHEKVPSNLEFKFEYMWDPLTGEQLEKDPNGPFYFNCKDLVKNFHYNRLRMLWVEGEIINGIKYEGYYGDGIGASEDLIVPSRGVSKHMHLFRLPVIDCYLEKDFDYALITMGPKLTDEEIDSIQDTLDKYYKNKKRKSNINLRVIRDLYNKAINKSTSEKDARQAVDELKKII
jgi:hypothetical protein